MSDSGYGFWAGPIVLLCAISTLYFGTDEARFGLRARILASAQGVVTACLYLGAVLIWKSGHANPDYEDAYMGLYVVPASLVLACLLLYRRTYWIHVIQVPNILLMAYTFFIGTQAISGNWGVMH